MKKILKFYSETCGPCKVMSKNLKSLEDVEVQDVDIADESNEELVNRWKIRAVPTIIVLDESDNLLGEFRGITPIQEIQNAINRGQTATD